MARESPDNGAIIEDAYPLSPLQQGMLLNTLMDPGSGVELVQMITELHEALDVVPFQRAWRCVIARHPVLRTSFRWENVAAPCQEVHLQVELPWEARDWRGTPDGERGRRIADFLDADQRRGFGMAHAPLFRLSILRYAEAEFHLVVTYHHAVLEGRSYLLVLREVFAFYEAFRRGEEITLPLPRPYRDYIDWLQQLDFSKHEAFWRETLRGFTAPTPLVVDHAPSADRDKGVRQGDQSVHLPTHITSALRTLAKDNQLTLNTIVNGAWALLLSRYSGAPDAVFGVIRASRRSAIEGADAMIGLFINTLPLRVHVNPESELIAWLREVRLQWTAMREHEQTPLQKVRAWCAVPAGSPLFESIVTFENHDLDALFRRQGGPWANRRFRATMRPNAPLALSAFDGAELILRIRFHRSRIDDAAVGRMLGHLRTLLEAFAIHPQWKIGEYPLLNFAERQQLLVEWNQTHAEYPRDRCVDELFGQQAQKTPDRVAVVFDGQRLNYRELNERSDQAARHLRAAGVGPGVLAGLYVERSLEMVVGLLAILKAGGAYVPLDPIYPPERLAFMLEDARPLVLLTQNRLQGQLPRHSAKVVCLDALPAQTSRDDRAQAAAGQRRSSDLAYVLYTSGSTGKPKGVQIPHRALVNFLSAMRQTPGLTAADTLLAVTTLSFDIAALELFLPLISGARVVIAGGNVVGDAARLSSLMTSCGATVMQATPATWRLLLEAGWKGEPNLKILCGGEAWSSELARELLLRCGSLWNMYGPTETTIWSSASRVEPGEPVLIGPPIANTSFYVLHEDFQPAPIGIPGELYIGGHGVARGYLNRPELTQDRFVADPFNPVSGARMYKTGDRVCHLPNGRIEFLGRNDEQVKIRGFRIELGEIEAGIARHPAVRQVAVIAREDTPGDKRLVAYLVADNPSADLADQLRVLIRRAMPEYMVPAHFVRLDALPLTLNGKVDRRSLPGLNETDGALGPGSYVAPRNDLEISLATVWERVLGVRRVGITDNFFDLGGDSFDVLRLVLEMEQATDIAIDLGRVFHTPTIAALAESLGTEATGNASLVVPLQPEGDGIPIFCLLGINLYRHFAESLGRDQPVYGVYVVEEQTLTNQVIRGDKPYVSTERMADAYFRAIARFRPVGPYRLAGLSMGGILAMEVAARMRRDGAAVDLVILLDTWLPRGLHRNWSKWLARQAAEVIDGHAWKLFRHLLRRVRAKIGKRWLPSAMQSNSSEVDRAVALRGAAFVRAIRKWRVRQFVFDFRVILCCASDRSNWKSHIEFDEDYGWRRYLSGPFSIFKIQGDHMSIMAPPNVALLGSTVRRYLRSAPEAVAEVSRDRSVNGQP